MTQSYNSYYNTVILEVEWVLRFAYKFTPEQICQAFRKLFDLPNTYLSNINAITLSPTDLLRKRKRDR